MISRRLGGDMAALCSATPALNNGTVSPQVAGKNAVPYDAACKVQPPTKAAGLQ